MRKSTFLLYIFIFLFIFSACSNKSLDKREETSITSTVQESNKEATTNEIIATTQARESTTAENINDDSGGAIIELRKYRVRYYDIPAPFAELVGRETCYEWEVEYGKANNVYLSDRMVMVDFINAFDISKEDFERANLELAKIFNESDHKPMMNPLDHANQEVFEIYNADIIYTFDDKIINEYYLSHDDYPYLYEHEYEEAVANGTYQTRTTDWIDIDQMEAEINAKYGEPKTTVTD